MALTEELPDWIALNARHRRLFAGALFIAVLLHGFVYFNQRAMFMPWNGAEHPQVVPTPTAFFAQVAPPATGGIRAIRAPARLAGAAAPAIVFDPLAPAGGGRGGAEIGNGGADSASLDLVDAPLFALAAGDDAAGGVGAAAPGASPSAVGAPAAFVGPDSVPEMSTWAMLMLGFGVIGGWLRRRGRRNAEVSVA